MGVQEQKVRKRKRKQDIQRAILTTIKLSGLITVAALAPNTLQLLKYAPGMRGRYLSRIEQSRKRLQARGLISIRDGKTPMLSDAGERVLLQLEAGEALKKPKRWDGSWRIVIFDIAERRRSARDRLRNMLTRIGFQKLQDSVWAYPYDCEDLITLIKTDFSLGREVLYIVSDSVEGDRLLKQNFNLR